jgi:hypothetical protein
MSHESTVSVRAYIAADLQRTRGFCPATCYQTARYPGQLEYEKACREAAALIGMPLSAGQEPVSFAVIVDGAGEVLRHFGDPCYPGGGAKITLVPDAGVHVDDPYSDEAAQFAADYLETYEDLGGDAVSFTVAGYCRGTTWLDAVRLMLEREGWMEAHHYPVGGALIREGENLRFAPRKNVRSSLREGETPYYLDGNGAVSSKNPLPSVFAAEDRLKFLRDLEKGDPYDAKIALDLISRARASLQSRVRPVDSLQARMAGRGKPAASGWVDREKSAASGGNTGRRFVGGSEFRSNLFPGCSHPVSPFSQGPI